jgi:acetyl-CoA acetyltransferase
VFGQIATEYGRRFGDPADALAAIAAKNHHHGMANPYAHMRRDFGFDFCRTPSEKNPFVAGPLKRSDCSLVSDGAAALVLSMEPNPRAKVPPIRWRSRTQVNDFMPMSRRDPTWFEGSAQAWQRGLAAAGAPLSDLSFIELHDCFTIAELLHYEAMGLAPRGEGAAHHRADLQPPAGQTQGAQAGLHRRRIGAEVDQQRQQHVAGGTREGVQPENLPHQVASGSGISPWLIRLAMTPAPKPLSMLTTARPVAQEVSIAISGVSPCRWAP